MKTTVAFLFGCPSVEHEVSIISAVQAMRAVDKNLYDIVPIYVTKNGELYTSDAMFEVETFRDLNTLLKNASPVALLRQGNDVVLRFLDSSFLKKKKDIVINVAFPVVHGTNCEDGTIQGYLEFLRVPYVGCDILSSAVGMDKAIFKDVMKSADLPVLDCEKFYAREYAEKREEIISKIEKNIGYPVIVKPINLGSSVGISKANDKNSLVCAIDLAISFSDKVLVEKAIENLREINCSVLGDSSECFASVCEEPISHDEILSYAEKYLGGNKNSKGMASLGRKLPAQLPDEKTQEIRGLAEKVFKALGANGVVRIDFMLDTKNDKVYVNEINTIPGSLAFYLWEATDMPYSKLINKLIDLAFKRGREKENLTFTIDTNILSNVSFGSKGAKGSKF